MVKKSSLDSKPKTNNIKPKKTASQKQKKTHIQTKTSTKHSSTKNTSTLHQEKLTNKQVDKVDKKSSTKTGKKITKTTTPKVKRSYRKKCSSQQLIITNPNQKRIRRVPSRFTFQVTSSNSSCKQYQQVLQAFDILRKHKYSKYLCMPQDDLKFTTDKFQLPYTNYVTLNDISKRMNQGVYSSTKLFYIEVNQMLNRNLKYLQMDSEPRKGIVVLKNVFEDFLTKHGLQSQVLEDVKKQKEDKKNNEVKNKRGRSNKPKTASEKRNNKSNQKRVRKISKPAIQLNSEDHHKSNKTISSQLSITIYPLPSSSKNQSNKSFIITLKQEENQQSDLINNQRSPQSSKIAFSPEKCNNRPSHSLNSQSKSKSKPRSLQKRNSKNFRYIEEIQPLESNSNQ